MPNQTRGTEKRIMLNRFQERIYFDFPDIKDFKLYLAISGGKDSMVLSHLLSSSGLDYTLLHCNFHLRGKESEKDEEFLKLYANESNLDIQLKNFDTYSIVEQTGKSIQETARDLRYQWFNSFVQNERTLVLTAHHLDDSIETFFINLLRGTGYKGIGGIPRLNKHYYRPLLSFTSDDIFKYIDEHNIDYREDSSNADTKYLRNRLRHTIVPSILEIEPSFKPKMNSFFEEINNLRLLVDGLFFDLKNKYLKTNDDLIEANLTEISSLDNFSLQILLNDFGVHRSNVSEFKSFLGSSVGSKFLSLSHQFLLDRENLLIKTSTSIADFYSTDVAELPASIESPLGEITLSIMPESAFTKQSRPVQLDANKVKFPLVIRNWQQADKIQPLGMKGSKLVSDILIDNKVSQFNKDNTLVIEDANAVIITVLGLTVNENVKVDDSTSELLQINF